MARRASATTGCGIAWAARRSAATRSDAVARESVRQRAVDSGRSRPVFAMCLPQDNDGLVGWVVRAKNSCEGILFQIECADSTLPTERDPRTRPNSLRSYVVLPGDLGSRLDLKEVIALSKPVLRGESHDIATECVGNDVSVYLDGNLVHTQKDYGMSEGSVGFRAGAGMEDGSQGAREVGWFRQIRLIMR